MEASRSPGPGLTILPVLPEKTGPQRSTEMSYRNEPEPWGWHTTEGGKHMAKYFSSDRMLVDGTGPFCEMKQSNPSNVGNLVDPRGEDNPLREPGTIVRRRRRRNNGADRRNCR